MNIGDKIFVLYTDRSTQETSCEGPSEIVFFLDEPHNDEGVIVVKHLDGKTAPLNLAGTASHDVDIHIVY